MSEMTFDVSIQNLIDLHNSNTDEYNQIVSECEKLQVENDLLLEKQKETDLVMTAQHKAIEKNFNDNKNLKSELAKQSIFQSKSNRLEDELLKLKKELKSTKEQVKRVKSANSEKDKKINRLEKQRPQVTENQMYQIYFNNEVRDETVYVNPYQLTLKSEGCKSHGYTLLYTNKFGGFISVVYHNDELCFISPLSFPDDVKSQTKNLAEKYLDKPSKECADFCREWLYKVNVSQKGKVNRDDLKLIKVGK